MVLVPQAPPKAFTLLISDVLLRGWKALHNGREDMVSRSQEQKGQAEEQVSRIKSFPNIVPNGLALSRLRDQMSLNQLMTPRMFHIIWHLTFCTSLLSTGVYVIGFSYPVVPKGKARIRVQISAAHTDEDIDQCVDAFIQTGRKHGVISWAGQRSRNRKDSAISVNHWTTFSRLFLRIDQPVT